MVKALFILLATVTQVSPSFAAEGEAPRVKARPKLRPVPSVRATAHWQRAGGLSTSGKVTLFEGRVLQRLARVPTLEVWQQGELVGRETDRFGYPIRYALRRSGGELHFTITRHNAYYDTAASVTFTQDEEGAVHRQVVLRAPGLEALLRRGARGEVRVAHGNGSLASGTNGYAETRTDAATKDDLALLRRVFKKRNAEFQKTPFDKWHWHAAGY